MSNVPAGWYPDNEGQQRYWDGEQWTEHVAPVEVNQVSAELSVQTEEQGLTQDYQGYSQVQQQEYWETQQQQGYSAPQQQAYTDPQQQAYSQPQGSVHSAVYVNSQEQPKGNGLGVAGFVLALIAVFLFWVPVVGWVLWALGLIFSAIGVFKAPKGLAIAGLVISLIDLILLFVAVSAFAGFLAAFS